MAAVDSVQDRETVLRSSHHRFLHLTEQAPSASSASSNKCFNFIERESEITDADS
jgi:hypothetical protein